MDILEYRDYCLSLPFVEESTPFDETTLVFKVGGRMFTWPSSAIPTKPSGCASATRGSRRRGTATNATGTTSTSTAI